ncbi:MAG TPA: hypothetical protein VK638_52480 [Edaphobacter sp.]|nr:hypothetical protein [Edaphobacter sp.]
MQLFCQAMNVKVDRIGHYITMMESRVEHCRKQANRYAQRATRGQNKIDRTKKMVAEALFEGMKGMRRLFQGAATVDSILRGELIERAAVAGLRSLFVGFETLTPENLKRSNKRRNLGRDYKAVADRLHSLGIMINGSFVFGMDDDGEDVFRRTVDWAIEHGITTATFHIQTPYPGTQLHARMARDGRMLTRDWNLYDTRHVVYRPAQLRPEALKAGYDWAYREFYRWASISRASLHHGTLKHQAKHFFYASGWKKFEPVWDLLIRARQLTRVTPMLEAVLSRVTSGKVKQRREAEPATLPVISPETALHDILRTIS